MDDAGWVDEEETISRRLKQSTSLISSSLDSVWTLSDRDLRIRMMERELDVEILGKSLKEHILWERQVNGGRRGAGTSMRSRVS